MTLRIGVLGAGDHSQRNHLPALQAYHNQHPGAVELVALCDLRLEHAAAVAERFGFPQVYTSLDEMLQVARLDACIAVTPVEQTVPLALRILQAGIPLLVEKPPGSTLPEARRLADLVDASGLPVMVSVNRRFDPALQAGLSWMADRPLSFLRATMARHARQDPDFITGTAIHLVDTIRYLGGDARVSHVRSWQVAGAVWTLAALEFESGASGILEILPTSGVLIEQYALFGPGYHLLVRVGGTDRGEALAWENGQPVLAVQPALSQPEFILNGTLAETAAFLDALRENRPPQPTPRQVLGSVEICHSIQSWINQEDNA